MKSIMQYDYIPPASKLKQSFKFRAKEYLLENTLHGVKYFVDASRPMWERVLWFILTMASIGLSIGIIITIYDKFQTDPTLTGLDTVTDELEIDFPQPLFCFDWSDLNQTLLDDASKEAYSRVYNWRWGKEFNMDGLQIEDQHNFRNTFEKMIPDCGLIFTNCMYGGKVVNCGKDLIKVVTPAGGCCKFIPKEPFSMKTHPMEFSFIPTAYNFYLYLTLKTDMSPSPADRPLIKFQVPTAVIIYPIITYTTSDLQYLTVHQRLCHYLSRGPGFRDCERECVSDAIKKKCGCKPWIFDSSDDDECPLSKYPCVQSNITTSCQCIGLCDITIHQCKQIVENPDANSEKSSIEIPIWPMARFKREIRFGYLDLVVSFGGIAGLFLGYSLLTTVELVYYFTLRPYCGAVLDSSQRKHNIVTVRVIVPKDPPRKVLPAPKYFGYTE